MIQKNNESIWNEYRDALIGNQAKKCLFDHTGGKKKSHKWKDWYTLSDEGFFFFFLNYFINVETGGAVHS